MQIEAAVKAGLVDVEGVAILHDELAHAQQARFGPRLVAELGLNLVPDLRQLLVAAQFAARDRGHDLFVRHAQAQVGALAVFQAEHVFAHGRPAAALLPRLAWHNPRQVELLRDLVHLVADNGDDLVQRALAQEEVVIDSGAELADVAGAEKKLVAGHFGVCRSLAQCGNKELRPTMHRKVVSHFLVRGANARQMNAAFILNVWRVGKLKRRL